MSDDIILVDSSDRPEGTGEKMSVHKKGQLHRAFSVLIFDQKGKMLLQKRADSKYHSAGLWANACCSHPRPGEETETAAHRRLQEEMGFDCRLTAKGAFLYQAELDEGLKEHEYDHVFFGTYTGGVNPDPVEVSEFKWIDVSELKEDIKNQPERYAAWFKIILSKYF